MLITGNFIFPIHIYLMLLTRAAFQLYIMKHLSCLYDIGIHQLLIDFLGKTLVFCILIHKDN